MDGGSPDEAHSVSAVAVIDLSDGGGGGANDPHGLLTSSVVVIGGDDGGHDTMGSASDGLMNDEDEEDEEEEASECGSNCGHDHGTPAHTIHIGRSVSQGFIVTGRPSPASPTASSTASMSTRGSGGKRKRVVLSLHEKQRVLQRLEMGEQPAIISRDFGISRQQVSDIKKNKDRILAFCIDAKHVSSLKRKTLKATTEFHPGVEQELYRWLIRQRRLGRAVTVEAITTKSTDLFMQYAADDAGNVSVRSISVWLRHFKRAHGIKTMSEYELAKLPDTFTPAMDMAAMHSSSDSSSAAATAPKEAPASALPTVDDVSAYMSNVDASHQSFLLHNHVGHVEYGAGAQPFQMFMLASDTASAAPPPAATVPPPTMPLSLQSCAHIAQTLTIQLSLFEREMSAKLHALDARVQKLGFAVLSSAAHGSRFT